MVLRIHDFQHAIELASNLINEMDLDPTKASTNWVRLFHSTRTTRAMTRTG